MGKYQAPQGNTKREILESIRDGFALTRGDVREWLGISHSVASKHLSTLIRAGLLEVRGAIRSRRGPPSDVLHITDTGLRALETGDMPTNHGQGRMVKRIERLTSRIRVLEAKIREMEE